MKYVQVRSLAAGLLAVCVLVPGSVVAEPQLSPRMEKAKDYIADEQWGRAIDVLKTVAADAKEKSRDEALFWLAHSQHQARDFAGALATIKDLERQFPKSRWVKPAGSIRVELAQKLRRNDVLWYAAAPPPPPAAVAPMPQPARPPSPRPGALPPGPAPATTAPAPGAPPGIPPPGTYTYQVVTPRPNVWMTEYTAADTNLRIQALGSLIQTDGPKVIPMLREIAMESRNPNEASRAVFVLAQSGRADAHSTVLELARVASEPVSVAAVRELGRFGAPIVSKQLLEVYEAAKPRVKYQIVNALGERAATTALMQIAQSEADQQLRNIAIVTLGQAGGRTQLVRLYAHASADGKRPIILGLFNARAEDDLIRIAQQERDATIRNEIHAHLRLLGTPKARAYLEKVHSSR